MNKIHRQTHKIMIISMRKSLILTSSSEKFSPSGGTPSGRLLKRRAVFDVPLCGGSTVSILVEKITHFVVFDHFDPLYMYSPLINGVESD